MEPLNTTKVEVLIDDGRWDEAARAMSTWRPPEIASIVNRTHIPGQIALMAALPEPVGDHAFSYLTPSAQRAMIESLPPSAAERLLQLLEPRRHAAPH